MKKALTVLVTVMMTVALFISCGSDPFFHEISLKFGDKVVETVIVQDGVEYTLPDKAGNVTGITGWIYNDKEYKAGAKITVTGDTTITAVGGTEGGSGTGSNDITVTYKMTGEEDEKITGDPATMKTWITDWTKTGYAFDGWYTEDNGGGTYYAADAEIKESMTLYAHWIDGNIEFDSNGYVKIKADSKDTAVSVVIPAVYQGKTVTSIASCGFQSCSTLETVTFEKPENITNIPSTAFASCGKLSSIDLSKTGIGHIGTYAFESCSSLTTMVLPATVTTIESTAFRSCTGLNSITLPENLERIDSEAFKGCTSLKSIRIPASVTEIADNAFENCSSLAFIYIDRDSTDGISGTASGGSSATVVLKSDTCTLTFDTQGGSYVAPVYVKKGNTAGSTAPADPTKDGYYFSGWTTDEAGTTKFDVAKTVINSNYTLYAQWKTCTIGSTGPAGGIIFYDAGSIQTGTYKDSDGDDVTYQWRYLEVAPEDIKDGTTTTFIFGWYRTSSQNIMVVEDTAVNSSIGAGRSNTRALVNAMKTTAYYYTDVHAQETGTTEKYAARLCDEYTYGGYDDWFLPSSGELIAIWKNLEDIASFSTGNSVYYWSSSEADGGNAVPVSFDTGKAINMISRMSEKCVRAVRAFK
jgi:uncharacterized repeat protein (TIGR02543 family)